MQDIQSSPFPVSPSTISSSLSYSSSHPSSNSPISSSTASSFLLDSDLGVLRGSGLLPDAEWTSVAERLDILRKRSMSRCQGLTTYERLIISRPNFESAQDNNHVRETDQLAGYNQAWESERTGSRASQDIRNIHEMPDVLGATPPWRVCCVHLVALSSTFSCILSWTECVRS